MAANFTQNLLDPTHSRDPINPQSPKPNLLDRVHPLAIGHGISNSLLDKIREVSIDFFSLPMEEKQKYARAVNEAEGYGSDRIVSDKQVHDWSHRLSLKVFPQRKRRLNLWPQIPQDFRETLDEYAMKIKIVTEVLFKAIAKSLNLEENG
ncbi:hypothetical protein LWI28_009735 [Acer negundo]|uniref:Non-haem dioxygenase N-terminal domain-containing protein n=1 Tax=Acer negundo TaxID=4023 RepID=A0AAD5NXQ4_ACENE|nr:hypothetical protein LWI28_009735 [Acer negundo]